MTDTVQVAITVAVAPTILAVGTLVVGIRNSYKSDAIHVLVNSNLTTVKTDLQLALDRVRKLEEMLLKISGSNQEIKKDIMAHTPPENPHERTEV
jgi:hypothetical protein